LINYSLSLFIFYLSSAYRFGFLVSYFIFIYYLTFSFSLDEVAGSLVYDFLDCAENGAFFGKFGFNRAFEILPSNC